MCILEGKRERESIFCNICPFHMVLQQNSHKNVADNPLSVCPCVCVDYRFGLVAYNDLESNA